MEKFVQFAKGMLFLGMGCFLLALAMLILQNNVSSRPGALTQIGKYAVDQTLHAVTKDEGALLAGFIQKNRKRQVDPKQSAANRKVLENLGRYAVERVIKVLTKNDGLLLTKIIPKPKSKPLNAQQRQATQLAIGQYAIRRLIKLIKSDQGKILTRVVTGLRGPRKPLSPQQRQTVQTTLGKHAIKSILQIVKDDKGHILTNVLKGLRRKTKNRKPTAKERKATQDFQERLLRKSLLLVLEQSSANNGEILKQVLGALQPPLYVRIKNQKNNQKMMERFLKYAVNRVLNSKRLPSLIRAAIKEVVTTQNKGKTRVKIVQRLVSAHSKRLWRKTNQHFPCMLSSRYRKGWLSANGSGMVRVKIQWKAACFQKCEKDESRLNAFLQKELLLQGEPIQFVSNCPTQAPTKGSLTEAQRLKLNRKVWQKLVQKFRFVTTPYFSNKKNQYYLNNWLQFVPHEPNKMKAYVYTRLFGHIKQCKKRSRLLTRYLRQVISEKGIDVKVHLVQGKCKNRQKSGIPKLCIVPCG